MTRPRSLLWLRPPSPIWSPLRTRNRSCVRGRRRLLEYALTPPWTPTRSCSSLAATHGITDPDDPRIAKRNQVLDRHEAGKITLEQAAVEMGV
jgi:hypothetical protein